MKLKQIMKNRLWLLFILVQFLFWTGAVAQPSSEMNDRKFNREDWKRLKEGINYSNRRSSGETQDNRNGNFENVSGEKESSNQKRGFGKYSDGGGNGSGGWDPDALDSRPRNRPTPQTPNAPRLNIPNVGSGWLQTLLLIVLGAVFVFVLYKIIADGSGKKNTRIKKESIEEEIEDHLDQIELPRSELEILLEKALQHGDFREAVRIYFIFLIKELRTKNWITWEKKKTNSAYLLEMRERPHFSDFVQSVRIFEIVWYGNRAISESDFRQVEPLFKQLIQSVEKG